MLVTDYNQSEQFFLPYRNEIRSMFRLRNSSQNPTLVDWENKLLALKENGEQTTCVHIRRGDFITNNHRLVNMSFYTESMKELIEILKERHSEHLPHSFFMFSDDIPFVQDYFLSNNNTIPIMHSKTKSVLRWDGLEDSDQEEHNLYWVSDAKLLSNLEDFHLMSKCHHNIMSASSFGWWAAYLNDHPDKIVIAAHHKADLFGDKMHKKIMYRNFYYPLDWIVKEASFSN
jgi:hypothetical protein